MRCEGCPRGTGNAHFEGNSENSTPTIVLIEKFQVLVVIVVEEQQGMMTPFDRVEG